MYGLLNIASLLLGLTAWAMPAGALATRRGTAVFSAASFGLCSLSLLLQIFYNQHLVQIGDWAAIEDTHGAVTFAAAALLLGTVLLNGLAMIVNKARDRY